MDTLKQKILPLALSLGILAVYLSLPTRNYYWDGIGFAQAIEDVRGLSPALFHPNHLVYTAAGYLDYRLVSSLGNGARALTVLRVTNSILSAAAAFLLFEILMACRLSRYGSAVLTLLFAFSATWWKFSTDANAYVPAVLLLLFSFRLLLPECARRPFLVALVHTAAMLFHELSVLFFPAIVVGLLAQTASLPMRKRLAAVLQYAATAFILTVGFYYSAFHWIQPGEGDTAGGTRPFLSWVASHSADASFSWNPWRDAMLSLRGHLRLLLGGRPSWVAHQWPRFTIAMAAILMALILALIVQVMKVRKEALQRAPAAFATEAKFRPLLGLLLAWIAAYELFLFSWLPGNTFYRLFYLPALVLLIGWFLLRRNAPERRWPGRTALLTVAIVAVANFTFDIFPNAQAESNPPLQFALKIHPAWDDGAVVYYADFNTDDWTIRYFNPQTSWKKLETEDWNAFSAEVESAERSGRSVWLDTTALDRVRSKPGGPEWLEAHAAKQSRVEWIDPRTRIVFQKIGGQRATPR